MIYKESHVRKSDNFRLARSVKLIAPADETYCLIDIPQFAFVADVWLYKATAYGDAGATLSVGFIGNGEVADPDGFIDATLCDADAAGMVRAVGDAQPGSQGKWFNDASGAITATCDDNAGTVGTFFLMALYSVIH